jgi:hypothetical protein
MLLVYSRCSSEFFQVSCHDQSAMEDGCGGTEGAALDTGSSRVSTGRAAKAFERGNPLEFDRPRIG